MRVVVLNVIKIDATCVRISYFKLLNSKAQPQVGIILSDKKCLVHPKMSFTSQHAVDVIYNMWVLHQLSLKLDSATINQICSTIEEHVNWQYITIVSNMTFLK